MEFLVGKSILITGATGFLAKVLVEKILRTQPDIKKLYLLIRANDSVSAMERFETEVIDSDLFRVVKEKYGDKFKALVEEKVFPMAGDISFKELGIQNDEQFLGELDIIINSAATTVFDESSPTQPLPSGLRLPSNHRPQSNAAAGHGSLAWEHIRRLPKIDRWLGSTIVRPGCQGAARRRSIILCH